MKFCAPALLCALVFASAKAEGVPDVKCADVILPPEEKECFEETDICTKDEEGCCDGLVCTGYGFYKRCAPPPICLDQWHDCSDGTPCCDDMCCQEGKYGQMECQAKDIGSVCIDPENPTEAPTQAPEKPDVRTTKIPGVPVETNVACSWGDPHVRTFDGLKYDCHGAGEHILAKSLLTQREVQARYKHMKPTLPLSIATAVVIQDEGITPKVQVAIAENADSLGTAMADGCTLQLFVDGEQKKLEEGSGSDQVQVTMEGDNINVFYTVSEMEVNIKYSKCWLDICMHLPDTDRTVGLFGTANGDASDEWTTLGGTVLPIPESLVNKLRKPGYDFCTLNYCIRDESQSLFDYTEVGIDFDTFQKCDLPYGDTVEKFLTNVPEWVTEICGGDAACILDVQNGDPEDAIRLRNAAKEFANKCNPPGGECDQTSCCDGLTCVDLGGLAGKVCDGNLECAPEFGACGADFACCDDMTCTEMANGDSLCIANHECQDDWMSCETQDDCCDGLHCIANRQGSNTCRKLPQCMQVWDDCSIVGCCGQLTCHDTTDGRKECRDIPGCLSSGKECSETACCNGLTCIQFGERQVCEKLPQCVQHGKSCEYSPCCEDEHTPLACMDVSDEKNDRTSKQCRVKPGDVEVRTFSDLNGNGIQDEGEPGIQGVKLRIVDKTGVDLEDVPSSTTDTNGIAKFIDIQKGIPLRVKLVEMPLGAAGTKTGEGNNTTIDSDLRLDAPYTNVFYQRGDVWTETDIGLLMPVDIEVHVFNDLNSDGIQDEGEMGLSGVKLVLESKVNGGTWGTPEDIGGSAHLSEVTGNDGLVTFTKCIQGVKYRVKVVEAPEGAIATKRNTAAGDEVDSDLNDDGYSEIFALKGGYTVKNIDLGYRLPETVMVRVWDDINSNGIQDIGEKGIEGVELQLINDQDKAPLTNYPMLTTNNEGLVSFKKVPQDRRLRVKVITPPKGGVNTVKNRGTDEAADSDLGSDGLSEMFTLKSSGSTFTAIDLGYKMPASMVVRIWDDENSNGVQDEGEEGIQGVKVQLIDAGSKEVLGDIEETNAQGFATFAAVPSGQDLQVQIVNAPSGALVTGRNQGDDKSKDSDFGNDYISDVFRMTEDGSAFTEIDGGFKMPRDLEVHVWDDANQDGVQDEAELGIADVELQIVYDNTKAALTASNGNAHTVVATDDKGIALFTGIPQGTFYRVNVVNAPGGATRTSQNKGGDEDKDSDLTADGMSDRFDLGKFETTTFKSVDLGYLMPEDMEVKVWNDLNANGIQDNGELGVEGVQLQIVMDKGREAIASLGVGNAHEVVTTGEDGIAKFFKVPKNENLRVKVLNEPDAARPTKRGKGGEDNDSELETGGFTERFNFNSWKGTGVVGHIDIGYLMPVDVKVRVWEDVNHNGIQDDGEPGVEGVKLVIVNDNKDKSRIESEGGGSTAHMELMTDNDGYVTFEKVPKNKNLKVKVMNAPGGSKHTRGNVKNDEVDSDLAKDMTSSRFNLNSWTTDGVYGNIDLGFKMPKNMVVRAFNDANGNGKQDDEEEGIPGVRMRIVTDKDKNDLTDQENGGDAHLELETGADGRLTFHGVPQGIEMRVKVTKPPESATVAPKNKGGDQLDSDLNTNGLTDKFMLPANVQELYDRVDVGYILN